MLKATELRIGNLVYNPTLKEIRTIDCLDIRDLFEGRLWNPFEPIDLTEEWLLRFGFVRIERRSETIYANGGFHLVPQGKGFIFKVVDQIVNYTTIRYVHTLQNLHFSLCGVELQPVTTPQHS